jgi:cyclin A
MPCRGRSLWFTPCRYSPSQVAQRSADEWVSLAVDNDRRMLYESPDLNRMEWLLLETVGWRIRVPNTWIFLRLYYAALETRGILPAEPPLAAAFRTCAELMAVSTAVGC